MNYSKKTEKLSLTLTAKNRQVLERIKEERGTSYVDTINCLIGVFGIIPERIKKAIRLAVKDELKEIRRTKKTAGNMLRNELEMQEDAAKKVLMYLTGKEEVAGDEGNDGVSDHRDIVIKEGTLHIPANWIMLNPEQATRMPYAGVVECRNSHSFGVDKCGEEIPHFVFFCEYKYGRDYPEELFEQINQMCCNKWPDFETVLECQVEPSFIDGVLVNEREWSKSPTIGYFHIREKGDPIYGNNEAPYGALIIRK